jgi:hypothetical protein
MHEHANPHVGGAGGGASQPAPEDPPGANGEESIGSGEIEVPLGSPVSDDEFRRLKREASSPGRDDAEEVTGQAQEDEGRDNRS